MDLQKMIEQDYDNTFYVIPEPQPEMVTPDGPSQGVSPAEFATGMAKTAVDVTKGAAQGFAGLPGDIEGLGRLLLDKMGVQVGQDTVLPTTDEVKAFLDKFIPTLTETAPGMDKSAAEFVGEIVAPGGYVKAAKGAVKGIKASKKVLPAVAATTTMTQSTGKAK